MSYIPQRPFVLVNMAMTADGKIATSSNSFSSFGSKRDSHHLYELRATVDAVMCGARTVDLHPVTLGVGSDAFTKRRVKRGLAPCHLRILVTGNGSLNRGAEVFKHQCSPIIILTTQTSSPERRATLKPLVEEIYIGGDASIEWRKTLEWLHSRWKVQRLLCEGGGMLNASLFEAGLVDELHLTICPMICGGNNAPSIAFGRGFPDLDQAIKMKVTSSKQIKGELFLTLHPRVQAHQVGQK